MIILSAILTNPTTLFTFNVKFHPNSGSLLPGNLGQEKLACKALAVGCVYTVQYVGVCVCVCGSGKPVLSLQSGRKHFRKSS